MTTAYWCVLIAAFLPFIWTGVAKLTGGFGIKTNREPRSWQDSLEGRARRAHNAHLNSFEAFPAFAAGVIIAHLVGKAPQGTIDMWAMIFIGARVIYGFFYIFDLSRLRSLIWMVGIVATVAMFVISA